MYRQHQILVSPLAGLVAGAVCTLALWIAPPAAALPETVLQDDAHLLYRTDGEVRSAMQQVRALGVDRVRLTASWSLIAPSPDSQQRPDFDAGDPSAYPAGNWIYLDRAVRMAQEEGLQVMIDVAFWAPRWATRDASSTPNRLRTEIDAGEYAQFAHAVAARYDGTFRPPRPKAPTEELAPPVSTPDADLLGQLLGGTVLGGSNRPAPSPSPPGSLPEAPADPLPAVTLYTLWNEPNLDVFLRPQWERRGRAWVPRSAEIYRAMVRAAYPAIKAASPSARVLIGGTAGTASRVPGVGSVPPLRFLRALTCVDERLRPIRTGDCAGFQPLPGDGWAHHPYSTKTLPSRDASDPNNVPVAGLHRLASTLRVLVRRGRLAPANADLYITEYGYETSPPDPGAPFGPERQGALLAHAEYLATRLPAVKMWAQFMLRDLEGTGIGEDWQSGLYFADGTPKPAASTFRTPTFATCVRRGGRRWTLIWGAVRGAGAQGARLESQRGPAAGWRAQLSSSAPRIVRSARRISLVALAAGAPLRRYVAWQPGVSYRISWTGADGGSNASPAVFPSSCPRRAIRHGRKTRIR